MAKSWTDINNLKLFSQEITYDNPDINLLSEILNNIDLDNENNFDYILFGFLSCNYDVINLLIDKGVNINNLKYNKFPFIHFAIIIGKINLVKILLNLGIDVDMKDYTGYTPLMTAVQVNNIKYVKLLVDNNADVNYVRNRYPHLSAKKLAKHSEYYDILEILNKCK